VQATTDEAAIEEEHSSLLAAIDKAAWLQTRTLVDACGKKGKDIGFRTRAPVCIDNLTTGSSSFSASSCSVSYYARRTRMVRSLTMRWRPAKPKSKRARSSKCHSN